MLSMGQVQAATHQGRRVVLLLRVVGAMTIVVTVAFPIFNMCAPTAQIPEVVPYTWEPVDAAVILIGIRESL